VFVVPFEFFIIVYRDGIVNPKKIKKKKKNPKKRKKYCPGICKRIKEKGIRKAVLLKKTV
jgi:hypothetical protein